jgi:biotin carboxyl carrier protein
MKLTAKLNGRESAVEIKRDDRKVSAVIDGRAVEYDASEVEPGIFLLKSGENIYEAAVSLKTDGSYLATIRGTEVELELNDPKRLRGGAGSGDDAGETAEIRSAMPGKIVRVIAAAGDAIKKGDGVLVVEAMKMQNELRSPRDGVVKEIAVNENDTVSAGQLLAVIE